MQWFQPNYTDLCRLFIKTKELFDREGVKFSLTYGSLLGAVREGSPIKGDNDVDTMVWDEDFLISKLPIFQREGLMVFRIQPGTLYSFTLDKSCFIDVYILRELTGIRKMFWGKSCVSLSQNETPRSLFTGWSEIEFMGEKITCPESPEKCLEFWYGSDWRIPQDKKGTYLVKSADYYNKFTSLFYRKPYLLSVRIRNLFTKIYKLLTNKDYRQKLLQRKRETGSYFNKH